MVLGRAAARFEEQQQQAAAAKTSAAGTDPFLSRLQQAEARDQQASSRQPQPTGGPGATDPRYREVPRPPPQAQQQQQQQQQRAPQHILPTSAYNHHAGYRQSGVPPQAAQAAREVQPYYGQQNLPGAHRTLVSRQRRHLFEPLQSQVDMTQPGEFTSLGERVSYPCNLPDGGNKVRGGAPHDRPAGGRANLAGRANANGTAQQHHHMRL